MGVRGRVLRDELRSGVGIGFVVALEFDFLQEQHWNVKPPPSAGDTAKSEQTDSAADAYTGDQQRNTEGSTAAPESAASDSGAEQPAKADESGATGSEASPPPPPPPPPEPHAGMAVLCEIGKDGALIRVTPAGTFAIDGPITPGTLLDEAGRLIVRVPFGALNEKLFRSSTAPVDGMRLDCTFDGNGNLTGYAAVPEPRHGVIRAVDTAAGTFELCCLSPGTKEDNWRLHSGLTTISGWSSLKHYKGKIAEHWRGSCPPAADMVVDAEFDNEILKTVRPSHKHWTGPNPDEVRQGHIHREEDGFYVLIVDNIPPDQIGNWQKEYPPFAEDRVNVEFSKTRPTKVEPYDGKTHTDSAILKWSHEFHLIVTRYKFDPSVHWKSNDVYPAEGLVVWCTFDDKRNIATVRPQSSKWLGIPKESLHRGEILMRPALPFVLSQIKLKEVIQFFIGSVKRLFAENEKGIVCAEFDFTRQAWARPAPLPEKGDRVWCEISGDKISLHSDNGLDERKERKKGKIVTPASQGTKGVVRVDGEEHDFTADDWAGLLPKPKPGKKIYCGFDEQGKLAGLYHEDLGSTHKAQVQRVSEDTGDGSVLVRFPFPKDLWRGAHDPIQGTEVYCDFDEHGKLTDVRPMAKARRGWVAISSYVVGLLSFLYLISDFVNLLDAKDGLKFSGKLIHALVEFEKYWFIKPVGWVLRHLWEMLSGIWKFGADGYAWLRDLVIDKWFLCPFHFEYLPPTAYKNLLVLSILAIAVTAWQLPWQKRTRRSSGYKLAGLTAAIVLGHAWYLSGWLFEINHDVARRPCWVCEKTCAPFKCPDGKLVEDKKKCCESTVVTTTEKEQPPITLYFDYKDSTWKPAYKPQKETAANVDRLKQVIARITEAKASRLIITGHTDTVGSDEYNFHLAQDRAETVRCILLNLMRGAPESEVVIENGKSVHKTCVRTDGKITTGLSEDASDYGAIDAVPIAIQATAFTNMKKPTHLDQKEEENRRVMIVVVPKPGPAKK
jgi:hypothetical protein